MDIRPFKVDVPEATLEDLRERLARTRWPDEIAGSGWDYGSNLDYVKELVEYWRTRFDWKAQEQAINAFSQFRAVVDGIGIHFVHERGKGPDPLPLIITHGWPGSFVEMLEIIPMLTDPADHGGDAADSFDVVAPSLPGYGFSDRVGRGGMSPQRIAELWLKLMRDGLGYSRFVAQGGDWGSAVTNALGRGYPQEVIGIHLNMVGGPLRLPGPEEPPLTQSEQEYLEERKRWWANEQGYMHIQRTKPQTLGYGLNDSPAGLAAWIVEKFRTWSDCGGDVESSFTRDELLTNITIYWVTQTINSADRLYYEAQHVPAVAGAKIQVPCGVAMFPKEISRPPRESVERTHNVQRWTEMPRGGHFAAMEEPELLAEDIRAFCRSLRV